MIPASRTSATDTDAYRAICRLAATDDATFRTFKRHPDYEAVVTNPDEWGKAYYDRVADLAPDLLDRPLHDLSAQKLRYLNTYHDLHSHFGPLDGMITVEIGGGYGGLAEVIYRYSAPLAYTIVDLPEAGMLQRRYLGSWAVTTRTPDEPGHASDLLISTWAFSECRREIQERYIAEWLLRAARGFLVCNFVYEPCLSADELQAAVPGSRWIASEPRTHPAERVLIWP